MMNETLIYYNKHAAAFSEATQTVDFNETQNRFLEQLKVNAKILDFGCGAGRDTKYFLEKGYAVEAIDGSEELCKIASRYTGISIRHMLFQELEAVNQYDGIWACSSILHLSKDELREVLPRMTRALKGDGIIYTSFKHGDFEGMRNGRYFTDFTYESFNEFIKEIDGIRIEEHWITGDVRPGREEEKWLNVIIKKISIE